MIIFKFAIHIFHLRLIAAAADYKITSLSCRAPLKTNQVVELCEEFDNRISLTLDFKIPLDNMMVLDKFIGMKYTNLIVKSYYQAKFDFYRMNNDKFRPMFKTPPVDWCSSMGGNGKLNSLAKLFLSSLKLMGPQFFHSCPYSGVHSGQNMTMLKQLVTFYPSGVFKLKASLATDDKEIFILVIDFTVF